MPRKRKVKNDEVFFDTGHVCVKISDYNELVTALYKLKIIEHMYRSVDHFDYDKVLSFIYGDKGESKDAE